MTEHEVCKGCQWNKYPLCEGIKMFNGEFMNIENIRPVFECGQKDILEAKDLSITVKSPLELKIEELEARITGLERL